MNNKGLLPPPAAPKSFALTNFVSVARKYLSLPAGRRMLTDPFPFPDSLEEFEGIVLDLVNDPDDVDTKTMTLPSIERAIVATYWNEWRAIADTEIEIHYLWPGFLMGAAIQIESARNTIRSHVAT